MSDATKEIAEEVANAVVGVLHNYFPAISSFDYDKLVRMTKDIAIETEEALRDWL